MTQLYFVRFPIIDRDRLQGLTNFFKIFAFHWLDTFSPVLFCYSATMTTHTQGSFKWENTFRLNHFSSYSSTLCGTFPIFKTDHFIYRRLALTLFPIPGLQSDFHFWPRPWNLGLEKELRPYFLPMIVILQELSRTKSERRRRWKRKCRKVKTVSSPLCWWCRIVDSNLNMK